jgi:hypothetical protein
MRVLINGLPLFSERLAKDLKSQDPTSTFLFLDTYNSKWAQLKFILLLPFADLVKHILADLNSNMKVKFMDCVIETIGIVPELVGGIEIDFESSIDSIWLIPSESIPSPKARDGVLSMEWRASIGENLKTDVSLYEVFLG